MPSFGLLHVWMMLSLSFFPPGVLDYPFPPSSLSSFLFVIDANIISPGSRRSKFPPKCFQTLSQYVTELAPPHFSETSLLQFLTLMFRSGLVFCRAAAQRTPHPPGLLSSDLLRGLIRSLCPGPLSFSFMIDTLAPLQYNLK